MAENEWRNKIKQESTLKWHTEKALMYEKWCETSLGGDLLIQVKAVYGCEHKEIQVVGLSPVATCARCVTWEMMKQGSIVMLACVKHTRDRNEIT